MNAIDLLTVALIRLDDCHFAGRELEKALDARRRIETAICVLREAATPQPPAEEKGPEPPPVE